MIYCSVDEIILQSYPTRLKSNFYFLLEEAEDEDSHEQRCQRNGVADSVHEMEPLKDLAN